MNGPWTLSDFPTMTLPYALGANGMPLGIQLTGPLSEKQGCWKLRNRSKHHRIPSHCREVYDRAFP